MSWIESLHSANWNLAGGLCLCAYVLGCFTSGYYLVRWFTGQDIRETGSGSVGARNVSRVLGKSGFLFTVLFDFGKGAFVVWAAEHFTSDGRLVALAMIAVVAGHIWPAQLRFRGGKGMATSLGSLVVFDPQLALTFLVLFLCLGALLRRTILPSLVALAAVPLVSWWLEHNQAKMLLLSFWAALALIAHRKNAIEEFSQLMPRHDDQPEPDQPHL
jgi:acyl phosphate:glycerol-3-phosphate acyltransferase